MKPKIASSVAASPALDERDDDLVHAGGHVQRDRGEALHDLGARGRAAVIDEREVLAAAELRAKHLVAVEQHDDRLFRLERARVEADVEVGDREPVLAVRRKRMREAIAATRAGRQPVGVAVLIAARRREIDARELRRRLADREPRDLARDAEVLLEECGRDAERRGDVVESVDLDLVR